ncbi:MAG: PIN domain-containing protein [Candidatus Hydrogenedentes bacterium]|nr:PIN domain-containing protein [Candidatus Hydrogenedentota bacterium]
MIFVDTSAWFASIVPDDADHLIAVTWLNANRELLVTSDYIIDETLTLLRSRSEDRYAIEMGKLFFGQELARIVQVEEEDILDAWEVFQQFKDKAWSFTDCTSKVLIEKNGIELAFAFDRHFAQFGTVKSVPST